MEKFKMKIKKSYMKLNKSDFVHARCPLFLCEVNTLKHTHRHRARTYNAIIYLYNITERGDFN